MLFNISKKTKIVCTIGPASDTREKILELYKAGMTVMRVNFSHGTHEEQLEKIKIARDFERDGIYIPVALDTKGPEIRTGYMKDGAIKVSTGQKMVISMEDRLGDENGFSVTYKGLYDDVKVGDHILIDDGNLDFLIIKKNEDNRTLLVEARNAHILKDQKGVKHYLDNLRNIKISINGKDLQNLGISPSPQYQEIFDEVLKAKLQNPKMTKEDELKIAKSYSSC